MKPKPTPKRKPLVWCVVRVCISQEEAKRCAYVWTQRYGDTAYAKQMPVRRVRRAAK